MNYQPLVQYSSIFPHLVKLMPYLHHLPKGSHWVSAFPVEGGSTGQAWVP